MEMVQNGQMNANQGGGGNVSVNSNGQLIGPDNNIIKIVTNISEQDKRKLLKEITAQTKGFVGEVCTSITEKIMDPLKRNVRNLESDKIVFENRIKARVDREVKETIGLFSDEINELRLELGIALRALQVRFKKHIVDNNTRICKSEK